MEVNSINNILNNSKDRFEFWVNFINEHNCSEIAEVGVFRGDFAFKILKECSSVKNYWMIDPWKNLGDWNKPANVSEDIFETYYKETMDRTNFATEKRRVLRGRTKDVIGGIPDNSLDLIYVDGDHTLRGISIDLISCWSKLKKGGYLSGDDLSPTIWQHDSRYEPSMVFPFAVYFAEAVNAPIYALPMNQFLIIKNDGGFAFKDLTLDNRYHETGLLKQLNQQPAAPPSDNFFSKMVGKFFR